MDYKRTAILKVMSESLANVDKIINLLKEEDNEFIKAMYVGQAVALAANIKMRIAAIRTSDNLEFSPMLNFNEFGTSG